MSSTASNTHQNTSGGPTSHNNKSTGATSTTDSSSHASAVYVATRLCETLFS